MTTGERCAIPFIKKIILILALIVLIIMFIASTIGCTPDYAIHRISYSGDWYPLRNSIIRSEIELNDYFSQEDYIIKGKYYDETISNFTAEFFDEKVLIPILYSDINNVINSIKKNENIIEIKIKFKNGLRPADSASLYFLELDNEFVKDATEVKIITI